MKCPYPMPLRLRLKLAWLAFRGCPRLWISNWAVVNNAEIVVTRDERLLGRWVEVKTPTARSTPRWRSIGQMSVYVKGGDRTPENMAPGEIETCRRLGIELVYGHGDLLNSSSRLGRDVARALMDKAGCPAGCEHRRRLR